MAELLKGAPVIEALNLETLRRATELRDKGIEPTLAILRVGERPDDIAYEKGAMKRCAAVGVAVKNLVLPADAQQEELMSLLVGASSDVSVHGILIFRPLPSWFDGETVRQALNPKKDVDGITPGSLAGVFTGSGKGFSPCCARACVEILEHYGIDCEGKRAVIIGRSLVVGRPTAILLMAKQATVTICHSRTKNLAAITREADIVVSAIGKAERLGGEYFKPGQIVIDVGVNWVEAKGKLCGDIKFDEVEPIVEAITPVPGGVGAVTTSVLVRHVVKAAENALGGR